MKTEEYDADTLRRIVRALMDENAQLKSILDKAQIPYRTVDPFKPADNEEFDPDQGGRIFMPGITEYMAKVFFSVFRGRHDVYARRSKNGGYFPQCVNAFDQKSCPKAADPHAACWECKNLQWKQLSVNTIINHLCGFKQDCSDVIGIYPLFPDGTCRLIVFDFDNHDSGAYKTDYANTTDEWQSEVNSLRAVCENCGIHPLVERSRSGKGAHVWIPFREPVAASLARNFGYLLLEKGAASVNLKSFSYYDRMFPTQDFSDGPGNLIALPLQGKALLQGNSAFVDENWNAYPNQWEVLGHAQRLSLEDIHTYIDTWQNESSDNRKQSLFPVSETVVRPWKKEKHFDRNDVIGEMHIVLCDGIYVDALNLKPRIQNQIRSMAAFDNPVFYQNRRMGYSNYNHASVCYYGCDEDGYIHIPRGLLEQLKEECRKAEIRLEITDERERGKMIHVAFKKDLRDYQEPAVENLLAYTDGILHASTAFGKTVVCSYLIAQRKVNTLILVQNSELLSQWQEKLQEFLEIDEEPPEYVTRSGKHKKRKSVIGILQGSKNTMTGIIDVAMIQTLSAREDFEDLIGGYGMVIMDECHHAPSDTALKVLLKTGSRYLYGVTATMKRQDQMEKVIPMVFGPVRHTFSAKQRAKQQGIGHYFIPRYTRVVDTPDTKEEINKAFDYIAQHQVRNHMILEDVKDCVRKGHTPVILTRTKEHAKYLADHLKDSADEVFLLYGDNSQKENREQTEKMKNVPDDRSLILVATDKKIGEGFDFPRLDVLMLVSPVSGEGRHEQFIGRLNRDYPGKQAVYVYDYVDSHMHFFERMYGKRLKNYRRTGFSILNDPEVPQQAVNAIYDSETYTDIFEQDLRNARQSIVISSPDLMMYKVERLLSIVKDNQEKGVQITIITTDPDSISFGDAAVHEQMIHMMTSTGMDVITKEAVEEHFAVIDDRLVWHGGMNLLGKEDIHDNLIRIENPDVAAELLVIASEKKENDRV